MDNPDPLDVPAICLTCSALGTRPHLCDDPANCPCGSDQCGLPPTPADPPEDGAEGAGD